MSNIWLSDPVRATSYGMKTYKLFCLSVITLLLFSSTAFGATKPSSEADMSSLSYVFYLYFDAGQLVGDRDYQVKYDVISEKFAPAEPVQNSYKVQIFNSRGEAVQSVDFDPKGGNATFVQGKVQVKAPYVPNGVRASFFDNQDRQLMTIYISSVALCNDDGFCSSNDGENSKTCPGDCQQARASQTPIVTPDLTGEGLDMTTILIYVFSGLAVAVGAWFIWKWLKKKREESFLPPPPSSPMASPPVPPTPPVPPSL